MNQHRYPNKQVGDQKADSQIHIISKAFLRDLSDHGYQVSTRALYRQVLDHLQRWLKPQQVALDQISPSLVQRFLEQHLPQCGCPQSGIRSLAPCRAALHCFLRFLGRTQSISEAPQSAPRLRAIDQLLREYDRHLDQVQGLSRLTRQARGRYAREWLEQHFEGQRFPWHTLKPKDLFRYVNARGRTLKATSLHALTVGLRSFLRFLEFTNRLRPGLVSAVPSPVSPPPQPPQQVLDPCTKHQFLRSFNRTAARGRRDYAIALCFSELALRTNEVTELTLEDVDWRTLTLRLRQTKQRRERLLPLPASLARALVRYLKRDRPVVAHRKLFLSLRAPRGRPLTASAIRGVIRRAFRRCGIKATGPYLLRRSWATLAHQRGAGLKLIADFLGHRSIETTAPYAQVHFEELRQAARPWPSCPR